MRPRIRTLKPETWSDEKIGSLSRDARLLFVGLVTMADDDGRIRALRPAILGHVFPYDKDAPRKLETWIAELKTSGIIIEYEHESLPYIAFPHWHRHQKINRPTPSLLPAPNGTAKNPPADHGAITEQSRSVHDGIGSDRINPPISPPKTQRRRRTTTPNLIASDGSNLGAFELAAIERLEREKTS